jgi:FtsZ-interacting cell division protein ZipA
MDYLRLILLVAGIFFVLIIYLVGRKSRQQNNTYDYGKEDDFPEFSANDRDDSDWHDLEEGVGNVRIVTREKDDYETYDVAEEAGSFISDEVDRVLEDQDVENIDTPEQQNDVSEISSEIIVLYILARASSHLAGDKINSAAQANGLSFGEMNIFHRLDDNGQSMFGMANMVEPGSFDPESMFDLETSGLTMFMKRSDTDNNIAIFEDMLECAYHISEMLGAQLCNQRRQPLTQSDAERYRELATGFDG